MVVSGVRDPQAGDPWSPIHGLHPVSSGHRSPRSCWGAQLSVDQNYFDHVSPSGEEPWDRMEAAGYSYTAAGENIAAGNPTAEATMQQWIDSDGHCRNIMSPDFSEIGVGYFPGGSYGHMWTQVFGSR